MPVEDAVLLHHSQPTLLEYMCIVDIIYLRKQKGEFSFLFEPPCSTHPFIILSACNEESWSLSQMSLGERWDPPWTAFQSIIYQSIIQWIH